MIKFGSTGCPGTKFPRHLCDFLLPSPSWQESAAPAGPVRKRNVCSHGALVMQKSCLDESESERHSLFTVTVALLVAVPCWLVATALYSAVSLTTHLREETVRERKKKSRNSERTFKVVFEYVM